MMVSRKTIVAAVTTREFLLTSLCIISRDHDAQYLKGTSRYYGIIRILLAIYERFTVAKNSSNKKGASSSNKKSAMFRRSTVGPVGKSQRPATAFLARSSSQDLILTVIHAALSSREGPFDHLKIYKP